MQNLSRPKIDKYLKKMIKIYQNIYNIGLENNELANPDQYLGKIQALIEFQAHLKNKDFHQ